MARNLRVKITGQAEQTGISADTVGQLRDKFRAGKNLASVEGNPADDSTSLQDGQYISFMPGIKGN